MKTLSGLTAARLREILSYDPGTGNFIRKVRTSNSTRAGDIAGSATQLGYWIIWVDGTRYLGHRLAWLYTHGRWPKDHIDHVNGDPSDNRLCNLREATPSQNHANERMARTNKAGRKGVAPHRNKFVAQLGIGGHRKYLGIYATPDEAAEAYASAAKAHFGEFARTEG